MAYKLQVHDLDFGEFIKAVDACTGDVYLETDEGDVLNLKSKLCQIMGLANIIKGASIAEANLRCTNAEDESKLFRFNLYRELPEKDNKDKDTDK